MQPIRPLPAALLALTAALLAPGAASAVVSWFRFDPGCVVQPGDFGTPSMQPPVTQLSCGAYGHFAFSLPGAAYGGLCPFLSDSEEPAVYPIDTGAAAAGPPCLNGSCLGRPLGAPWVAVVDWNAPHGWTVAATVREASDGRVGVELFDLGDRSRIPAGLLQVGDVHVLAQLCAVVERAAEEPLNPPLAVNLSFGRLPDKAADKTDDCAAGDPSLQCEIEGVLSHLRSTRGTLAVAAAGNNGRLLFPAASPQVIAAGSINLDRLGRSGQVGASAETPSGTEALVPGYGLYLTAPGNVTGYWPAPAGSSYAAALLTGWIAGTAAGAGDPHLAGESAPPAMKVSAVAWAPVWDGARYWLARNGEVLPGSALIQPGLLLKRALGRTVEACPLGQGAAEEVTVLGKASPLPDLTLPDVVSNSNGSQPGSHPCVPCHGGFAPVAEATPGLVDLRLDLAASAPFPPHHQLEGVYLQTPGGVYAFKESQNTDFLDRFAHADLPALLIKGLDRTLTVGQLSLVYALRLPDGTAFRDATPIHVHAH